jgi:hypothetical protein
VNLKRTERAYIYGHERPRSRPALTGWVLLDWHDLKLADP